MRATLVLPVSVALLLSANASGVTTTFDSGFEGWTQTSGVTEKLAGGNPGGYLEFRDAGPADGGQISAPQSYHGDWLATYGANGTFSIDYRVIQPGSLQPFPMAVKISGPAGYLFKLLPGDFTVSFGWTSWSAPLISPDWTVSGDVYAVLGNVTAVQVFMPSASNAEETTGVDNISVRGSMTGQVTLEDFGGVVNGRSVTVEIVGGLTHTATLDGQGRYSVPAPSNGTYSVRIKGSHWLTKAVGGVVVTDNGAANVNASLINGDVDGDNEVGPGDFGSLATAFLSVSGDPNWNEEADLDGDGEVGPGDFGILATNFLTSGD